MGVIQPEEKVSSVSAHQHHRLAQIQFATRDQAISECASTRIEKRKQGQGGWESTTMLPATRESAIISIEGRFRKRRHAPPCGLVNMWNLRGTRSRVCNSPHVTASLKTLRTQTMYLSRSSWVTVLYTFVYALYLSVHSERPYLHGTIDAVA